MATKHKSKTTSIIVLTAASVSAFLAWANYAEIDQVSRASGQVIPAGRVQLLQSTDGGVISAILVKEGDIVHKGQKLVQLDRVKIEAAADEGLCRFCCCCFPIFCFKDLKRPRCKIVSFCLLKKKRALYRFFSYSFFITPADKGDFSWLRFLCRMASSCCICFSRLCLILS